MATSKNREAENSWWKLAIWLGKESSIGQQGISAFATMILDNVAFLRLYTWTWPKGRPHSPNLDWLLQKKLSLPRQPSDKSLTLEAPLYRFVKSYNALLVSQVKFISPGGPWQGPNRPGGFGDWCQQWCWLANSTDSCFTRLSGLNHTPLRMQIVQVVFPNEHCGPGYSSM